MEFFASAGDNGCKNKPVGGELLYGKRHFAEVLMITLLGIPLISFVGTLMNSTGGRKNFAEDDLSVVIS